MKMKSYVTMNTKRSVEVNMYGSLLKTVPHQKKNQTFFIQSLAVLLFKFSVTKSGPILGEEKKPNTAKAKKEKKFKNSSVTNHV